MDKAKQEGWPVKWIPKLDIGRELQNKEPYFIESQQITTIGQGESDPTKV